MLGCYDPVNIKGGSYTSSNDTKAEFATGNKRSSRAFYYPASILDVKIILA